MNHDPNDVKNGELDQTRLTAYALDQLEGAERAAVEARLADSDRSHHTVEEIRALAAEVSNAADLEPLPPRSPELLAVLEQYLPNEEESEMNAKPEPSPQKAPRQGRRRSTLIWAAAVCALVAAIPGYVLISGSLRRSLQSVAVREPAPEASADAYDAMRSGSEEFSYKESGGVRFADGEPRSDVARLQDATPAAGQSSSMALGKQGQVAGDSSGVAIGERPFQVFGRRVDENLSKPSSAAMPEEGKSLGVANETRGISAKKSVTLGMEATEGVFSADLDIPFSQGETGGMMGSMDMGMGMGGMDMMMGEPSSSAKYVGQKAETTTESGPAPLAVIDDKAPAPAAGKRPVMLRGSLGDLNIDGMATIPPASPAPGLPSAMERQLAVDAGSPVQIETLEQLNVGFLRGEAKKGKPKDKLRMMVTPRVVMEEEAEPKDEFGMELWLKDSRLNGRKEGLTEEEEETRIVSGRYLYRRSPSNEQYDPIVENKFLSAADHPESTFSVDVDSASYANVRRFLDSGRLPPPNAVRIEELVNYFRYDYPQPDDEVPFSVNMETAQCPWETEHRLVRIGLKGREIDPEQRGPSNLVFLLDVSGSMRDENKLPLVQYAMGMLVDQLTEDDRVAIVTYAGNAGVALDSTSGEKRKKIRRAIDNLSAGGSTHGSAGIVMAYDQAMQHFVKGGTNRVILCTDGDLNVGLTTDDELVKLITQQAKSGVFLTVLGFGSGNLKDSKMEKLADKGNGIYAYVDGRREARRVLVEQMAGSLVTIAKDVKVQIEFNPAEVASYRLIGYENRIMAAKDFDNDKKDAGEIGAGHTVTALYEIVPGSADSGGNLGRELKYQRKTGSKLTKAAASGELFTLYLRYKEPEGEESTKLKFVQKDSDKRFGQASADFRFASSVAAFGMLLRGSQYAGDLSWSAAEEFAAGSLGEDPGGYRNEFLELIHRAGELRSR